MSASRSVAGGAWPSGASWHNGGETLTSLAFSVVIFATFLYASTSASRKVRDGTARAVALHEGEGI